MSARVVAVTTLLLQVLEDLCDTTRNEEDNSPAETAFVNRFARQAKSLVWLRDEARAEMGAQVVKVLQT